MFYQATSDTFSIGNVFPVKKTKPIEKKARPVTSVEIKKRPKKIEPVVKTADILNPLEVVIKEESPIDTEVVEQPAIGDELKEQMLDAYSGDHQGLFDDYNGIEYTLEYLMDDLIPSIMAERGFTYKSMGLTKRGVASKLKKVLDSNLDPQPKEKKIKAIIYKMFNVDIGEMKGSGFTHKVEKAAKKVGNTALAIAKNKTAQKIAFEAAKIAVPLAITML